MGTKKPKRGAPRKAAAKAKSTQVQFRANPAEKQAFAAAAELDGKSMSDWIRDRLRRLSREELQAHGREVAFLSSHSS